MVRRIGLFLALCFGASWAIVGAFLVTGAPWEGGSAAAISVAVVFPPGIAALAVKGAILGEPVREAFGLKLRPNRWFLWAWLLPVALLCLTALCASLLPGVDWSLSTAGYVEHFRGRVSEEQLQSLEASVRGGLLHPVVRDVAFSLLTGATVSGAHALMQELAWRGFLHHEIHLPFWPKTLVIGLIWGIWRIPVALLGRGEAPWPLAAGLMLAWCLVAAPVFGIIRERSGSLLAVAIFHGTLVATAGISPLLTRGGDPTLVGAHGMAGIVAMGLVLAALALTWRERDPAAAPGPRP